MATFLNNLTSIGNSLFSWLTQIVNLILANPLLVCAVFGLFFIDRLFGVFVSLSGRR